MSLQYSTIYVHKKYHTTKEPTNHIFQVHSHTFKNFISQLTRVIIRQLTSSHYLFYFSHISSFKCMKWTIKTFTSFHYSQHTRPKVCIKFYCNTRFRRSIALSKLIFTTRVESFSSESLE